METTKKEFKGTKGEWFVSGEKWPVIESKNTDPSIIVTYPTIATINSTFREFDEYTANAKLIAAAPELLAACQEFVRKVEAGEAKSKKSYEQMKSAISSALEG